MSTVKYDYWYGTCDEGTIEIDSEEIWELWGELESYVSVHYNNYEEFHKEIIEDKVRREIRKKHGRSFQPNIKHIAPSLGHYEQ